MVNIVLRWVAVLPLSVLAAWLAFVIAQGVFGLVVYFMGFDPEGLLPTVYKNTMPHFLMGGALIASGCSLAPSYKRQVVIILLFLLILHGLGAFIFVGIKLDFSPSTINYWAALGGTFEVVGAALVSYTVWSGEKDTRRLKESP